MIFRVCKGRPHQEGAPARMTPEALQRLLVSLLSSATDAAYVLDTAEPGWADFARECEALAAKGAELGDRIAGQRATNAARLEPWRA